MKIDWKAKLSSRKFWAAIIAFITTESSAIGLSESITAKIILMVSGIAALCIYMLSEAIVDAARIKEDK